MASITTTRRTNGTGTATLPARRCFTVDEYDRMIQTGIVREGERVELLAGEIIQMAAMGSRHAACIADLNEWFVPRVIGRAITDIQLPIRLSAISEPEPDLMLLRPRPDRYRTALPRSEDVLLLVEVSDTTLRFDRNVKLPLYAAAGIPEVWLVDLPRKRVFVYQQPEAGGYGRTTIVSISGSLSPSAFPDLLLPIAQIVGS